MNFKVFPASLINGQKVPLIKGWNELASNDPNQIKLWQEMFRDRITFWGVPCGAANGIVALDIDVKKINGFESLKKLGYELPNTLIQRTPSGGCHAIFRARPGVHYNNTVNSELGLDTRGDRGWIAWYGNSNNVELAECPDWFSNLSPKPKETVQSITSIRIAPEIAQAAFCASLENIRQASPGESNNVLNTEAFKVGQLVASGSISREFAEAELFKAAKDRGKPDYESRATIKSGIDGGLKNPLTNPFGDTVPSLISNGIPGIPEAPARWTPTYLTRHDLLNTSKLRKPQLFQDWSTEDLSITTADGGTGKTTLKLFEAICLALGDRFLGFTNCQRGKTLFITGEDTVGKLGAILGAIMKQMGLFESGAENEAKVECVLQSVVIKKDADLCMIAKDKQNFLHPNASALDKLRQAIDDLHPKLIVFDPISSFWGSEAALNDMNKAVTRFCTELVDYGQCCVELLNHMGKSSSSNKDMSQFAGRGGSGLPSNSRVSRVLRSLPPEEYSELTGLELTGDTSAMLCQINKFSDGSPLFNKPFIILRNGYLFSRIVLNPAKAMQLEKQQEDGERIFTWIAEQRRLNKYPSRSVVTGHFMTTSGAMSADRVKRTIDLLVFQGHLGNRLKEIPHPDLTIKQNAIIIVDTNDVEV